MAKLKFDIIMKVQLCEKHKAIFEKIVRVKLAGGEKGIRPGELVNLWRDAENCTECKWETTFGKSNAKIIRDKVILECGCELEKAGGSWFVTILCKKHKGPYYKNPRRLLKILRSQVPQS